MYGENEVERGKLKGYLLELVLMKLLKQNNYIPVNATREPKKCVRENKKGFVEFKGRGCWHQIDLPFDYNRKVPFIYPIRLLGEAKFHKKAIKKAYIREYIGVLKDIQENYVVASGSKVKNLVQRRLEVGTIFSASGFQKEAEKLAYAHGIKTISYKNNPLFGDICKLIDDLEENHLSVKSIQKGNWKSFREHTINCLEESDTDIYEVNGEETLFEGDYKAKLEQLCEKVNDIKTSFVATTATGFMIHFLGEQEFPEELFREGDIGHCRVYYNGDVARDKRSFWLVFSRDWDERKFYFSPPESLDRAIVLGRQETLNEKEEIFRELNVSIKIDRFERNLRIMLEKDWFDGLR